MSIRELSALKRLPALELSGPAGAVTLQPRESVVLLLVRDAALPRARKYIADLEACLRDLRVWDAQLILVTEKEEIESELLSAKTSSAMWKLLSVDDGRSALIIADRWGVVYFAQQTDTFADLPAPERIEEWVRFLATQCPECGVIDEPGHGEWEM